MHFTITDIVQKFKREWTTELAPEAISKLCKELGLSWRDRLLTPATTVQLMLLQILHGNTAISHLPHLAKLKFCPSSFCRARMRLPLSFLETLLARLTATLQKEDFNLHTWLGHRVFIADGTAVSMPDTPELESHFGYPPNHRKGAAFPVARLVFMLHQQSGMIAKLLINRYRSHEAAHIQELHPELGTNDILLGDRAFSSYAHFCLLIQRGAHLLVRMNQKMIPFFYDETEIPKSTVPSRRRLPEGRKRIKLLGKSDHIVCWKRPSSASKGWDRKKYLTLPDSIIVRELLYQVTQDGFRSTAITVITTLTDVEKYSAEKIAELYGLRWEIETNFNHLKTTLRMDILTTKTVDGIKRELLAFAILYNLVRLIMIQAAQNQNVPVNRISFIDALRFLASASPEDDLPPLVIVPKRPGRFEPRSRKRRPKPGYPCMMLTRQELRKKKLSQCVTA